MKNTAYILSLSILFLSLIGGDAFAQKKKKVKKYSEEITIIAPYQPSISDARKIDIFPKINYKKITKAKQSYSITPQKLNANFSLEPLSAVRVKDTRSTEKLFSNYIKAGIGNYKTPFAELYSASKQSDNLILGVHLKHLSSSGTINDYATSSNSHNKVSVFGKKIFKNTSVMGNIDYNREMTHYYGFKPNDFPGISYDDNDIKRVASKIETNIKYASSNTDSEKLQYSANANFYHWWDDYNSMENCFTLTTHAHKPVEWLDFIESEAFAINAIFEFYNSGDSIEAENSIHMHITPQLKVENGFYELAAGVSLSSIMADTNSTEFKIFPEVYAKVHIIPGYFSIFGGITGYENRQTFKNIVKENPFTIPDVQLKYTTTKLKAYGGFTGNISRWLDFTTQASYSSIDNHRFYINDIRKPLYNQFKVIYDDVTLTHIEAEFDAKPNEKFSLNINGHYYNYSLDNEEKAWHEPEMAFNFSTSYLLIDPLNIRIKTQVSLLMNRYAKVNTPITTTETVKLDNITDISISAEYYHTKRFSAFLNINNILGQNYDLYYNYPSYGLNIMGGVTYSF